MEQSTEESKQSENMITLKPNYKNIANHLFHFSEMIEKDKTKTRKLSIAKTHIETAMLFIESELKDIYTKE